jgi:methionine synthase II (cobalamin-independent)
MTFKPFFLPTGIGSLPYKDPYQASKLILKCFPESPFWPQLPNRGFRERMLIQFIEGMPGLFMEGEKVYFRKPFEPPSDWEKFYQADFNESEDLGYFGIGEDFAAGFHAMLGLLKHRKPSLIKGQITGPITLSLSLLDEEKKPIFYDPNLKEMLLKTLAKKARWQEKEFKKVVPEAETLIFFDEPFLSAYGSLGMNIGKGDVIECIDSCTSSLQGLTGIHVCGNTDWSVIMETRVNVIHFDAYRFFPNMLLHVKELKTFLLRGGMLGWGIVPSEEEFIEKEEVSSLVSALEERFGLLVKEGIPKEILVENSILTQSCGLGSLAEDLAEKALRLTRQTALRMRERYES